MEATGGGFVEEEDTLDDFFVSLEDYVPTVLSSCSHVTLTIAHLNADSR